MLDGVILWAMHNPLAFACVLAATGAWVGIAFIPFFHQLNENSHPRC